MPDDTTTTWTVSVSRDTDIAVRSFLAQRGMKKGDLSKFVEDAVKWRVLDQTMDEARDGFAEMPADAVEALADEAVTAARRAHKALPRRYQVEGERLLAACECNESRPRRQPR